MKLRIRELRQATGLNIEQLAEKAGISRSYLNELEIGAKVINANRLEQIARALSVRVEDLFYKAESPVPIAGRVGPGAEVPMIDCSSPIGLVSLPPQLAGLDVMAIEVIGDAMHPVYPPGAVLFFSRPPADTVPDDCIGNICVAEDVDGHAWVKLIRRGSTPGLWNLISINPTSDSIWDARLAWAARVRMALPRDLVRML